MVHIMSSLPCFCADTPSVLYITCKAALDEEEEREYVLLQRLRCAVRWAEYCRNEKTAYEEVRKIVNGVFSGKGRETRKDKEVIYRDEQKKEKEKRKEKENEAERKEGEFGNGRIANAREGGERSTVQGMGSVPNGVTVAKEGADVGDRRGGQGHGRGKRKKSAPFMEAEREWRAALESQYSSSVVVFDEPATPKAILPLPFASLLSFVASLDDSARIVCFLASLSCPLLRKALKKTLKGEKTLQLTSAHNLPHEHYPALLSFYPHLTRLFVIDICGDEGDFLPLLSSSSHLLKRLVLQGCTHFTHNNLRHFLSSLSSLRYLVVRSCGSAGAYVTSTLSTYPFSSHLTHLEVDHVWKVLSCTQEYAPLAEKDLVGQMCTLRALREVRMERFPFFGRMMPQGNTLQFATTLLFANNSSISDETLAVIALHMRHVLWVDVARCLQITSSGVLHLAKLLCLRVLNINDLNKVDPFAIEQVAKDCVQLSSLSHSISSRARGGHAALPTTTLLAITEALLFPPRHTAPLPADSTALLQTACEEALSDIDHLSSCPSWRSTMSTLRVSTHYLSLSLRGQSNLNEAWATKLQQSTLSNRIVTLHFAKTPLTTRTLSTVLRATPLLHCLDVADCKLLTPPSWTDIASLQHLRFLNIAGCKIVDGCVDTSGWTRLLVIDLSRSNVADATVQSICQRNPHLLHLSLANCYSLTSAALANVKHLRGLQTLNLSACKNMKDSLLSLLASSPSASSLTSLNLNTATLISDLGIVLLSLSLQALQNLSLASCSKITSGSLLSVVKRCRSLRSLDACFNPHISDDFVITALEVSSSLRLLHLRGCDNLTRRLQSYLQEKDRGGSVSLALSMQRPDVLVELQNEANVRKINSESIKLLEEGRRKKKKPVQTGLIGELVNRFELQKQEKQIKEKAEQKP